MKKNQTLRAITEGAIMLALATVLSLFKLFQLPAGGSVNLSMIPILFYCIRWGVGRGMLVGLADGILQMLLDGAMSWGWVSIILDYLVAFTLLGLCGVGFRKKAGVFYGPVIGVLARFAAHFISGVTAFAITEPTELLGMTFVNPYLYSAVYNGSFLLIDLVICLVVFAALYAPLKKYFLGEDLKS